MEEWKYRLTNASVLVALTGLAFVVGGVTLWYVELAPSAGSVNRALFELAMHVIFGGVVLVLGIHIERSELLSEEQFAAIVWCYGGFTLMFVLSVWGHLDSIVNGELTVDFVSDFVVFTSLGGAFGLVSGVNWGRATKNQLLAEQNEEQKNTLALLTRLLSHDIRNDISVVKGYADLLTGHVDEQGVRHVDVIQKHLDETEHLLTDANALVKSLDDERTLKRIDLSDLLAREVRKVRQNHPDVEIDADISDGTVVEGDSLITQLFSNLLQNAVFHNDADGLEIHVTAAETDRTVAVVVSDNGDGIPPEVRETCFELGQQGPDSDGDGIGLYLVSRLAEVYGGTAEVGESASGGARFRVALPAASS
jgi:signal transduction histidine kinase